MKISKQVFRRIIGIVEFLSVLTMVFGCLSNSTVKDYMTAAAWCYLGLLLIAVGWVAAGGEE